MTTEDPGAVETAVRRYFAVVADLGSTEDDLRAVIHPEARLIEHPNPITPEGADRDVEQVLAGFRAGKALLAGQTIDVHDVMIDGDRAAVRATWVGVVGADAGPFARGTRIVARMGGFLRVRDGVVVEHETYDCYAPLDRAPADLTDPNA
jgi:ketosteroid isomerase-like protein